MIPSLLLLIATGIAAIPEGYYDDADGLSGTNLQQALHDIIDNHTVVTYSSIWTHFQTTDVKSNGKVWDMYSDNPSGSPPYEFTFVTDQCGNYSDEGDCYNREHSWPKSWFDDASPMYTDLFHIVPTDGKVNGMRSNYPFGEVSTPTWTSDNGSKLGPNTTAGYSGTVFEPIDEYKGDFARNYFYMATRYYGEDTGWTGSDMVDGSQLENWAMEMMLDWHSDDPVSQKETDRNDAIYGIQSNRNPFIDHPEYAAQIWSSVPDAPSGLSSSNVTETSLTLTWTDNASDEDGYYVYQGGAAADTLAANSTSANVTGLVADTEYVFEVSAYNSSGESVKSSHTVSTSASSGGGGIQIFISEVSEGTATSTEFLELYNNGTSSVDISNYKIVRVNASTNASEYVFDIGTDGTAGDESIPAKGFWVLSRGANRSTFESGFGSFPGAAAFYQGSTELYFASGTARRWRLRSDDGTANTDDGTLVDDTEAAAGGSGKRTVQTSDGNFTTSTSSSGSSSSPGEADNDQSLGVSLSMWYAESENACVTLHWATESERENLGYIILRDGTEIASYRELETLTGQGSAAFRTKYLFTDKSVNVGEIYCYELLDVDYEGQVTPHPSRCVTVRDESNNPLPRAATLHTAYPNPFNPHVCLSYTLFEDTDQLDFSIFNLKGELVKTLASNTHPPGTYQHVWNGKTNSGTDAPAGIYILRLSTHGHTAIQRLTYLK